jgi:hypothetical protein
MDFGALESVKEYLTTPFSPDCSMSTAPRGRTNGATGFRVSSASNPIFSEQNRPTSSAKTTETDFGYSMM